MRSIIVTTATLLLVLQAPVLSGQEREIEEAALPRTLADRLLGIVHDPATLHLPGDSRVPADSVIPGDVVVMGALTLAGSVQGDLVVIHGDLELEPGARVDGYLTVVEGEVTGAEEARVGGTLTAYRRDVREIRRDDRVRQVRHRESYTEREVPKGSSTRFGVRGDGYNRVEGLPVRIGPVLDTGGRNPFRAETQLIWRTGGRAPLAADRLGHRVTVEQFLGGRRSWRVGAGVHSTIDPVELRGLSDREHSWSTLALTRDERDHVETRGWSVFARATPRSWPVDGTLEFRNERHGAVGVADPWTLFRSGRAWRPQPLVAEGSLRSGVLRLELDTRDDPHEAEDGWLGRARWQQGLGGDLAFPSAEPVEENGEAPGELTLPGADARFQVAGVDLRRYQPVGRAGVLALRGSVGGSVDGDALPPQFQRTLGGVGTLPGHPEFAADCGARADQVLVERDDERVAMFPFYGCDRFALFQAEYRGPLRLDLGFGSSPDAEGRKGRRGSGPSWAVFFNAGRAWAAAGPAGRAGEDPTTLYDAGLGLLMGRGGVYWALPLGEGVRGSTLTIRLDRRF